MFLTSRMSNVLKSEQNQRGTKISRLGRLPVYTTLKWVPSCHSNWFPLIFFRSVHSEHKSSVTLFFSSKTHFSTPVAGDPFSCHKAHWGLWGEHKEGVNTCASIMTGSVGWCWRWTHEYSCWGYWVLGSAAWNDVQLLLFIPPSHDLTFFIVLQRISPLFFLFMDSLKYFLLWHKQNLSFSFQNIIKKEHILSEL